MLSFWLLIGPLALVYRFSLKYFNYIAVPSFCFKNSDIYLEYNLSYFYI